MAKIKRTKKGEKRTRGVKDIDVKKMTCTISHVTQLGTKEEPIPVWLEHEVDLSGVSMERVLYHAVSDWVIKKRQKAFKCFTFEQLEEKFKEGFIFRPDDYPADRVNGVSNEVKIDRVMDKMSSLEKITWLKSKGMDHETAVAMVDGGNF